MAYPRSRHRRSGGRRSSGSSTPSTLGKTTKVTKVTKQVIKGIESELTKQIENSPASSFWLDENVKQMMISNRALNAGSEKERTISKYYEFATVAKNFISILTKKNIPVKYAGPDSATDGEFIILSTDISNFDINIGLALHEASHIVYTDMYALTAVRDMVNGLTYNTMYLGSKFSQFGTIVPFVSYEKYNEILSDVLESTLNQPKGWNLGINDSDSFFYHILPINIFNKLDAAGCFNEIYSFDRGDFKTNIIRSLRDVMQKLGQRKTDPNMYDITKSIMTGLYQTLKFIEMYNVYALKVNSNSKARVNSTTLFSNFIFPLFNYIEDRRIDALTKADATGYVPYYDAINKRYFDYPERGAALLLPEKRTESFSNYMSHIMMIHTKYFNANALIGLKEISKIIDLDNITKDSMVAAFEKTLKVFEVVQELVFQNKQMPIKRSVPTPSVPDKNGDDTKESETGDSKGESESKEKSEKSPKEKAEKTEDSKDEDDGSKADANEAEDSDAEGTTNKTKPDSEDNESDEDSPELEHDDSESTLKGDFGNVDSEDEEYTHTKDTSDEISEDEIDAINEANERESNSSADSDLRDTYSDELVDALSNGFKKQKFESKNDASVINTVINSGSVQSTTFNNKVIPSIVYRDLESLINNSKALDINTTGNVTRYPNEEDVILYKQAIQIGKMYASKMAFRNDITIEESLRKDTGDIDEELLSEFASFGNRKIFLEHIETAYNKSYVHISIDGSGSMSDNNIFRGEERMYMTRFKKSLQIAAIIASTYEQTHTHVVIDVRGETDMGKEYMTNLYVIYDSNKNKLSSAVNNWKYLIPAGCTPESLCYDAISKEIIANGRGKESYFLNICDGGPYTQVGRMMYNGEAAYEHIKTSLTKLQHVGIETICLMIGDAPLQFSTVYGEKNVISTYNNFGVLTTELRNRMTKSKKVKI
jgi:hypothetical protein